MAFSSRAGRRAAWNGACSLACLKSACPCGLQGCHKAERPAQRAVRIDPLRGYLKLMIGWSTDRLSPCLASNASTTQSCSARNTFSIFIASITASFSPALTS